VVHPFEAVRDIAHQRLVSRHFTRVAQPIKCLDGGGAPELFLHVVEHPHAVVSQVVAIVITRQDGRLGALRVPMTLSASAPSRRPVRSSYSESATRSQSPEGEHDNLTMPEDEGRFTVMPRHTIEGVVLDTHHNPLEGVSVKLYRLSYRQIDQIGCGRTGGDGGYVVAFEAGSPVLVRYDHLPGGLDDCHPALVSRLSGEGDQHINVVMCKAGMPYERDELLDILSAYERVYLIDVSRHIPVDEIQRQYRAGLGMMKYVDEITRQRYEQVKQLYEPGE
jgi:hypothetical protein